MNLVKRHTLLNIVMRGLLLTVITTSFSSQICWAEEEEEESDREHVVNEVEKLQASLEHTATARTDESQQFVGLIVKNITIEGNKYVTKEAILSRLPFKIDTAFDADQTGLALRHLYSLGNFHQVRIDGEKIDDKNMNLYVVVEEKKLLEKCEFRGNKLLRSRKFKEKLNLDKQATIDEELLQNVTEQIRKMYQEENRHLVKITHVLEPNKDNPDKVTAIFTIDEGPKSMVKFVKFSGNEHFLDRKLRGVIFSRENWLLSFMDNGGTYNEEALEIDKHRIEYFYRDNGYLMVKVHKAQVDYSPDKKNITVTFSIKEGPQFFVRELHVEGDDIYGEDELFPLVRLEEGKPYAQQLLMQSMNNIKDLYGENGYIYCDVFPQVKPDEKSNEVDITFHVERGKKLFANRVVITGNKVTHDKVIRRQLEIDEGDLITTKKLNQSRASVEYLSFFERDSVKWKLHRISDELVDLEMNVQEAKTGNLNFMLSYGTDQYNPTPSMRAMVSVDKLNLFGRGYDVGGLIQADRHRVRRLEAHFFDPHIFDSDISTGIYAYKRWDEYEQWSNSMSPTPIQKVLGGDIRLGFWLPQVDKRLQLVLDVGIEDLKTNHPKLRRPNPLFEPIIQRTFQEGTLQWIGLDLVKDTRDHQVYPREGYKMTTSLKTALPGLNNKFGFIKGEIEASFYTALIDKFLLGEPLVLALHAKMGTIHEFRGNKPVPYKELYHIGGQNTVRGFTWSGIGPAWINGDPLGARNALIYNAELVFPLIPDYSMKGHLFYDAGAGWDTPKQGISNPAFIMRDKFDLRHAIGFGLNLMKPVPAKIDWGFKLDRKKNESAQEFHLSMNYAW
jgi:outer membrane protein insertion porin family